MSDFVLDVTGEEEEWWDFLHRPISGNAKATVVINKGGEGSGFHGHVGRPGLVGGSSGEGSSSDTSVSDSEEYALHYYTSNGIGAIDMNDKMRHGKALEPLENKVVDGLMSLCNKGVITHDKLYRGVSMTAKDISKYFVEGKEFVDNGFMSTSSDNVVVRDYATHEKGLSVIMTLDIPKGTHGYDFKDEQYHEVILPPGTKLRIHSVKVHAKGNYAYVFAEVIQ